MTIATELASLRKMLERAGVSDGPMPRYELHFTAGCPMPDRCDCQPCELPEDGPDCRFTTSYVAPGRGRPQLVRRIYGGVACVRGSDQCTDAERAAWIARVR